MAVKLCIKMHSKLEQDLNDETQKFQQVMAANPTNLTCLPKP